MNESPRNGSAIRILHVLGGMNRGGAETWLMHVLRSMNRGSFRMDFAVHTESQCTYDDEIRSLGSRVIPCTNPHRPVSYARQLRQILNQYGPYDVVHSHVHHFTGLVLKVACAAGVPVRIAHSHNDTRVAERGSSVLRNGYLRLMEWCIRRYATRGFAASAQAAASLFGEGWRVDPRWRTLYCGIDLDAFRCPLASSRIRAELGLPADGLVVGHVGRFSDQKNHAFVLDVAVEIVKREPSTWFLFVGDGPLRARTERDANVRGLSHRAVFAGERADVPRLMRSVMDVLVFPSLFEGLPLVLLESQAAGLPALISDVVTGEAEVVAQLVHRLSLSESAGTWADTLLQIAHRPLDVSREEALQQMEASPFNIRTSISELASEYRDRLQCAVHAPSVKWPGRCSGRFIWS